jgi:hypothetical protein
MEKAMAMLHTAGLSYGFWEFAVDASVHIYNHTPTCTLQWWTPYELWNNGTVPDILHLHMFGCKAYMHVLADKWWKLDEKSIVTVLVGYEPGNKGYKLWDHHTHSVKLSRDVTFDESGFPSLSGETVQAVEPTPVPTYVPVAATVPPNMSAMPPKYVLLYEQPPSPTRSNKPPSSEGEVDNLLDNLSEPERPTTPPAPPPWNVVFCIEVKGHNSESVVSMNEIIV